MGPYTGVQLTKATEKLTKVTDGVGESWTGSGSQLIVVSDTLNVVTDRGRRKLSVVTDRAPGKRSAVLHFYLYRTRIGSHI